MNCVVVNLFFLFLKHTGHMENYLVGDVIPISKLLVVKVTGDSKRPFAAYSRNCAGTCMATHGTRTKYTGVACEQCTTAYKSTSYPRLEC